MTVEEAMEGFVQLTTEASYGRTGEHVYGWEPRWVVRAGAEHPLTSIVERSILAQGRVLGEPPALALRLVAAAERAPGGATAFVDEALRVAVDARDGGWWVTLNATILSPDAVLQVVAMAHMAGDERINVLHIDGGFGIPCLAVRGTGWLAVLAPMLDPVGTA